MTELLALILGASAGWWAGHSTARIVVRPVGATAQQDQAALDHLDDVDEHLVQQWHDQLERLDAHARDDRDEAA
ncbi:hypothetical protein ACFU96_48270 [Streptomyces sp. NPDC057620]|uniref:hypothetical protein n=1 Tax=Streptomyces sp. NPDC057620 TaxID=3346185 RepID=UPI0036B27EEA